MYDIQKASLLKRISAGLLDVILLVILAVGFMWLISVPLQFDANANEMQSAKEGREAFEEAHMEIFSQYEQDYNMIFRLTDEQRSKMSEEEYQGYYERAVEADQAMRADTRLTQWNTLRDAEQMAQVKLMNNSFLIATFGILLSVMVLEFIVPLCLKNGMTVGKKVFSIGVMHTNGVKVDGVAMFIRAILGKYTIAIMVPVYLLLMMFFGMLNWVGILVIALLGVLQIVAFIVSKTNGLIHDVLAKTITVDFSSQLIFDSVDELMAYKTSIHEIDVENAI